MWADKAYAGAVIDWARQRLRLAVQIVRRPETGRGKGFHILPRRWVVERTFAWITRRRRCARDYERHPATHQAWVHIAAHMTMTRQLARHTTKPT